MQNFISNNVNKLIYLSFGGRINNNSINYDYLINGYFYIEDLFDDDEEIHYYKLTPYELKNMELFDKDNFVNKNYILNDIILYYEVNKFLLQFSGLNFQNNYSDLRIINPFKYKLIN